MKKEERYSLHQWLSALFTAGETPSGLPVKEISRVSPGSRCEVVTSNGHFGSGGVFGSAVYIGAEPRWAEQVSSSDNGFARECASAYIIPPSCVIYMRGGDGVNGGRVFYSSAIVCASDAQIELAKHFRPFIPTGWKLRHTNTHGYWSYSILPRYWGEPGDIGYRLANKSCGAGELAVLLYFPVGGGKPEEVESWWREYGAPPSEDFFPESVEQALGILHIFPI